MDGIKTGDALLESEVITEQANEEMPDMNVMPMFGLRLNFANGSKMQFEFAADNNAADIANEINDFMQSKVRILDIKEEDTVKEDGTIVKGKRPFRASDVLPRRKATLDIAYNGTFVKSSLTNVACNPYMLFEKNGNLFNRLVKELLTNAQKSIAKKNAVALIA